MLTNETTVTLAEAAAQLPRLNGKRIHTSALWRWGVKGVRGVRLEMLLLGGRYLTSLEALERFGRALAETGHPSTPPPRKIRPECSRRKAVARAEADLRRAGI